MANTKNVTKTKSVKNDGAKPRIRKKPQYKSFRLSRRIKHPVRLSSAPGLFGRAFLPLKRRWKLFFGVLLVYTLFSLVLGQGFSSRIDIVGLKGLLGAIFEGRYAELNASFTLFKTLLGNTGSAGSEAAGVYQFFLAIMVSLAFIWALRQYFAAKDKAKIRIRDAYYKGMYPLVPFMLVMVVIGLQLLPLIIGGSLYNTVVNAEIATTGLEKFLWILIFFLGALLSFYMMTSSIFALYIVTLSDMTPFKALRSARQLVLHRRWSVLRKLIFLPVALLVIAAVVMMPVIMFVAPIAEWLFFALTILGLAVTHGYLYGLYRELL